MASKFRSAPLDKTSESPSTVAAPSRLATKIRLHPRRVDHPREVVEPLHFTVGKRDWALEGPTHKGPLLA